MSEPPPRSATHLQYCPQPVNKYRSARKHTPQMQAPLPSREPGPASPHPHPTACSPTPVGSSALPKHQPTTSATTRARNLLGPSMPPPSLQEIYSPYAFSLPAGNLLPPPPFYIHAPLPLLLPTRPPRPETYWRASVQALLILETYSQR